MMCLCVGVKYASRQCTPGLCIRCRKMPTPFKWSGGRPTKPVPSRKGSGMFCHTVSVNLSMPGFESRVHQPLARKTGKDGVTACAGFWSSPGGSGELLSVWHWRSAARLVPHSPLASGSKIEKGHMWQTGLQENARLNMDHSMRRPYFLIRMHSSSLSAFAGWLPFMSHVHGTMMLPHMVESRGPQDPSLHMRQSPARGGSPAGCGHMHTRAEGWRPATYFSVPHRGVSQRGAQRRRQQ